MRRMRELDVVLEGMTEIFSKINTKVDSMAAEKKVEFIVETNAVQREWLAQAVKDGYLNYEQGFKMSIYPDHEIQLSVMDQLDGYNLHQLFQVAYELIDSSYLKLSESKELFEACLDAYRRVYF